MPAFITITDFKQVINKNPDTAQDAFEKRIVEQFKKGQIDIRTYKESIKRLDFMFDVLSIRKNIFGEKTDKDGNLKYLGDLGKIKKTEDSKEKDPNVLTNLYNFGKEKIGGMFDE